MTRLRCFCAAGISAALRRISCPTGDEPVNAIVCTRGSRTSAAPTSPSPGQQRERVGGHARLAQRAHEHERAARRLLGGLEHDGVAGREPRGDHPAGDRDREVPGRDHGDDAARAVAERVALARHLQQLGAGLELDGAARVVLEEVDRLAHVGVRLRPRLGALAHLQRGDLEPVLAQPGGGAREDRGALRGRPAAPLALAGARPPRARRRRRPAGAAAARATTRSGAPGSVETSASPARVSCPTQTGTSSGRAASCARSASASPARTGARRSSSTGSLANAAGLIGGHGGASSCSSGIPLA